MAYIRLIPEEEAEGRLALLYEQARKRAGKVFQIVQCMSLAPHQLQASIALYRAILFGESPLTRAQREMVAVVVSKANGCHY